MIKKNYRRRQPIRQGRFSKTPDLPAEQTRAIHKAMGILYNQYHHSFKGGFSQSEVCYGAFLSYMDSLPQNAAKIGLLIVKAHKDDLPEELYAKAVGE